MNVVKRIAISLLALPLVALPFVATAEPSHVYLTYSSAPETSIDVNLVLPKRAQDVEIRYDTEARSGQLDEYRHRTPAMYHRTVLELVDGRIMHVATLIGLKPGTDYYFVAGDPKGGFTPEKKFRTLSGGDAPLRFVDGGDMGSDGRVLPLLTLAAKESPDFAVIGGDIAYAESLGEFQLWDRWLTNWEQRMVTPEGRTVPLVVAIGNHEVSRYDSPDPELRSPWYVGLFGRQSKESYHTFRAGKNAVFFLLDTGHLSPYEGAQAEWLGRELTAHADARYKFASYHVPLYPAHRSYDGDENAAGRKHWGTLFDQHGLTVAFEHHDHVFKRSKRLKGNQVVEEGGTIYLGDGCFGKEPRTIDPAPRWYNEIEKSAAHYWVVDVTKKSASFKAIDEHGAVLDQFTLD